MKSKLLILLILSLALVFALTSCEFLESLSNLSSSTDTSTQPDTDSSTESEKGTDSESDLESDIESDSDTDTDLGSDSDTDSDIETDTDTETDTDSDVGSDDSSDTPPVNNCKHQFQVTDPAVEPTCSSVGYTAGKHCSLCGEITKPQQEIEKAPHVPANSKNKKHY